VINIIKLRRTKLWHAEERNLEAKKVKAERKVNNYG
jgi:hypothetical protein